MNNYHKSVEGISFCKSNDINSSNESIIKIQKTLVLNIVGKFLPFDFIYQINDKINCVSN